MTYAPTRVSSSNDPPAGNAANSDALDACRNASARNTVTLVDSGGL